MLDVCYNRFEESGRENYAMTNAFVFAYYYALPVQSRA